MTKQDIADIENTKRTQQLSEGVKAGLDRRAKTDASIQGKARVGGVRGSAAPDRTLRRGEAEAREAYKNNEGR